MSNVNWQEVFRSRARDTYTGVVWEPLEQEKRANFYNELAKDGASFFIGKDNKIYRTDKPDGEPTPDWFKPTTIAEAIEGYFTNGETRAKNGKEKGVMRVRHIHIIDKPRYIGKEVSEVLEEIAEDTNGELLAVPDIGIELDGVGSQIYEPDNTKPVTERLKFYHLATIGLLSGIPYTHLQRIKNGRVHPHAKTEALILGAMDAYKRVSAMLAKLSDEKIAEVIGSSKERAMDIRSGSRPMTKSERRKILEVLSLRMNITYEYGNYSVAWK